jgi:hypothetical protein
LGKEIGFRLVDAVAKDVIPGLSNTTLRPVFIRITEAEKALSNSSVYPTLGIDSTLCSTDRSIPARLSPRQHRTSTQCGISSTAPSPILTFCLSCFHLSTSQNCGQSVSHEALLQPRQERTGLSSMFRRSPPVVLMVTHIALLLVNTKRRFDTTRLRRTK